jgi:uncharacterized membrane protein
MDLLEEYDISPERAWLSGFVVAVLAVAGGSLVFTQRIYDEFIYRYFLGPVRVDATAIDCLIYDGAGSYTAGEAGSCVASANQFVVTEGYTITSTISYILILVYMIFGLYLMLDRFDLQPYPAFLSALFPFMLFGGVLRTVEDAFIAAIEAGISPALEYPTSAVLISPFIYFTVFGLALGAFLLSKYLNWNEITETWTYPLGLIGVGMLGVTFLYLVMLSVTTEYVTLYPTILLTTIGVSTLCAVGAYYLVDMQWSYVHEGTGLLGLLVIWGHAIDGVANVLANDWTQLWHGLDYGAKHPFNQFIMDTTSSIQGGPNGQEILGVYVGEAWPFLIVKLIAPLLILALFDEEFMDDSPRFSILLLGAVIAVGLGPGTRDMVRVAFAI